MEGDGDFDIFRMKGRGSYTSPFIRTPHASYLFLAVYVPSVLVKIQNAIIRASQFCAYC
jgi:hypothetical protein